MNIVEVCNIKKSFGASEVLQDVSLSVREGEVVALIGPSGSGKTTLLRCMTQLETVSGGSIEICGHPLVRDGVYASKAEQHKIQLLTGLVFQQFNLFPHLSVLENIMHAPVRVMKQDKAAARENALRLLQKMNLGEKPDAYPCELSGGQQQRVSIARALALSPRVLFFDEPTSALDPQLTAEILRVMRALAAEKMTMVVVTHEMSFARDVADRVVFMANGRVVQEGAPAALFGADASPELSEFLNQY